MSDKSLSSSHDDHILLKDLLLHKPRNLRKSLQYPLSGPNKNKQEPLPNNLCQNPKDLRKDPPVWNLASEGAGRARSFRRIPGRLSAQSKAQLRDLLILVAVDGRSDVEGWKWLWTGGG